MNDLKHEGGAGSVLAVVAQNFGPDRKPFTKDDVLAPLNERPVASSVDQTPGDFCRGPSDRVRGFTSFHRGGAHFVYGDGSVHFITEDVDMRTYIALSTISGGEVVADAP